MNITWYNQKRMVMQLEKLRCVQEIGDLLSISWGCNHQSNEQWSNESMDWCTSMGKFKTGNPSFQSYHAWEFEDFADTSRDDFEWLKIGRKENVYITQTPLLRSWWNSISTRIIHKGCGEVEASWIAHQVVCFVYPKDCAPPRTAWS